MALGFDQETFLKERDAKWKMQHARSLELGKCSVAELRHILELAKVQVCPCEIYTHILRSASPLVLSRLHLSKTLNA